MFSDGIAEMKTKEQILIEQINQKRREGYHELFRLFYQSLVMYAMKYLNEQEEAEDVVQDVFVSVWEKKEEFHSYLSFQVFLYNSVKNTCLNRLKHKKVEEKYVAYQQQYPDEIMTEQYEFMEEEVYRRLFKTVDELPPRCREVFLLHLDGKKNEEIAALLNITLLTVKTQKKKAVRYLRQQMGPLVFYFLYLSFIS